MPHHHLLLLLKEEQPGLQNVRAQSVIVKLLTKLYESKTVIDFSMNERKIYGKSFLTNEMEKILLSLTIQKEVYASVVCTLDRRFAICPDLHIQPFIHPFLGRKTQKPFLVFWLVLPAAASSRI